MNDKAFSEQIPFDQYRARSGINQGLLMSMDKSPKHFRAQELGQDQRPESSAFGIGRLVHTAVLEPELFDGATAVWTGGLTKDGGRVTYNKNSNAYKDFAKQMDAEGRQVLDGSERELCHRIRGAVAEHSEASRLLHEIECEVSVFWEHPTVGLRCKSRLDILKRGEFIADLKTSIDISPDAFGRAAHRYGYGRQAAFYRDAAHALTGKQLPYYIIAVEKCEPFDVAVYELPPHWLDIGASQNEDALRKVRDCRASGEWPGVAPSILTLEPPPWAMAEDLDWTGMEASA